MGQAYYCVALFDGQTAHKHLKYCAARGPTKINQCYN